VRPGAIWHVPVTKNDNREEGAGMSVEAARAADESNQAAPRRALEVPFATIGKILLAAVALWIVYRLASVVTMMLVAIVLAVTFDPVVAWLERRRVPRWLSATLIVLLVIALVVGFIILCGSSLSVQGRQVIQRLVQVQEALARSLPPPLAHVVVRGSSETPNASTVAGYAVAVGGVVANAVLGTIIASILTIYLLIEGRMTWQWLVAYVPRRNRGRVEATADAARKAVQHYVAGNVATSVFAAAVVSVALWLLKVPAALLLALLAGLCDFVPVLGFVVSAVPAILLALTVSPGTALAVAAVYAGYHIAENYLIGPKVYGGQLRLSNLAVLVAFAVGAELAGVVGALLALPIAAMYPVIEDVWLREYLGRDAVETHKRIAREA
jgi:predicted PurR-regulated permease PerM